MTHITKPNSLLQLWEIYQQTSSKSFPLKDVYLQLPEAKIDELKSGFVNSPIKTLPPISILQDLKPKEVTFDSHLQQEVQAKSYFPLIMAYPVDSTKDDAFTKFMLH